ncbi:MAG: ATP-dependent Clp protease ATP-binding subunit [Patescibacteria group bacterium]|nr:ATP-dependent Clp protease ATP-binding subunit [Patescibacteria group bacterium]
MEFYAKIYYFYRLPVFIVIRYAIFALLYAIAIKEIFGSGNYRLPLFFFSAFLMVEVFFRFKIARLMPFFTVSQNDEVNIYNSFTLSALELLIAKKSTKEIINSLLKEDSVQFILKKSGIKKEELQPTDIPKDDLSRYAFKLTRRVNGHFVTKADIFASFILITEDQTKLLFSKKIKTDEFLHILHWTLIDFPNMESPKPFKVEFWGEGIGEEWVYGWTLETQKYTKDLTYKILKEKHVLIGRNDEYRQIIETLSKKESNNLILVGNPGVGINAIVENLAFQSYIGELQGNLYHKRFFELLVSPLLAGTKNQGDLELRLQEIVAEISHAGNVIIYIPEFQNITGGGSFNLDLSGALLPYLKDQRIQTIGTVTPGNYKKFVEPMNNLTDLFEVIKIEEPNETKALEMVLGNANLIETKNKVSITYRAIVASLNFANKYMQDKSLPGSAITLLQDGVSKSLLSGKKDVLEEDVIKIVEEKTKIPVSEPNAQEKELLLHLEDKIHERVIDQKEGVSVIAEALRRIRTGMASSKKPVSFLFLGPTGVGKTETAKALSSIYFKSEDKMIRLDMSEYSSEDSLKRLLGSSPGEGSEKGELTEKVYENPASLILLDEFEKANPHIHDLFLQVLDDGRLTDNKGKTVSFSNTIIIATSNAGSEFIREEIKKGTSIDKNFQQKLLDLLQSQGIFKPELLNRFDAIVAFKPLGAKEAVEVVKLLLKEVSKKLSEKDINIAFNDRVIEKIVKEGINAQFGARPLRRFIQDNIEDLISQKMLKDELKRGDRIIVSVNDSDNIVIST